MSRVRKVICKRSCEYTGDMPLRSILLLLPLISLGFSQPPSPGGTPQFRVIIPNPDASSLRHQLNALGYDVTCMGDHQSHVECVVSNQEFQALQVAGLGPLVAENAMPLPLRFALRAAPAGYKDLATITSEIMTAQANFPGIVQVMDAASTWGPGSTFEGRPIHVVKISDNVGTDEDEPNVLMVACHHAREITTPEVVLDTLQRLTNNYGVDPVITQLVNENEIWLAPVWNPDGYNHVFTTNNLWRKNRRPFGMDFGVDLNRNYDLNWGPACGGSSNASSDIYSGPAAQSEAETQTMAAFAQARRFAKVMDYHSFGQEVLQTYACSQLPPLVENYIDLEAATLAGYLGYSTRDPSADGEHYEWQIKTNTNYAFLTEIDTSFQPNYAQGLAESQAQWGITLPFLQKPVSVTGIVTNLATGLPIEARIDLVGATFTNGETRYSLASTGRYHLMLPPGQHQLAFSRPGFVTDVRTVTVTATGTFTQDVALDESYFLQASTSGGGTGDGIVTLTNHPVTGSWGLLLLSLETSSPLGQNANLFGLHADLLTLEVLRLTPVHGGTLSWLYPIPANVFPLVPLVLPPGSIPLPAGTQLDLQSVVLDSSFQLVGLTPPWRLTF